MVIKEKLKEKCGVFAINNISNASSYCALGLHMLQHRGQEGAGIVTRNGENISSHYISGQVNNHFAEFQSLSGNAAIGHVRYSTSGKKVSDSLKQPICNNSLALAHNGNLIEISALREKLREAGCVFQSGVDTEVLIHLIASNTKKDLIDCIIDALSQVKGAYSLVIMSPTKLVGIRDPMGIRPLVLGKLGKSYILSSESCALDVIGAKLIRDVKLGEMIIIDLEGDITSIFPFKEEKKRLCIFEYIYFARPDSVIDGLSVYEVRKAIGREIAKEEKIKGADIVVPVPDSGVSAALGYSEESGLPFELGIIRNHYVGRTFIQPTSELRNLEVKLKHNTNNKILTGKKVILIDDSIVRGTTSRKIVDLVRNAGAKEIHMRISSPPITHPCFYGIDTPEQDKLIAANKSVKEIAELIKVDSLTFISIESLYKAIGDNRNNRNHCDACFTGNYLY